MLSITPFSGSYAAEDVQFLLKAISLPDTPVAQKEILLQSGRKHYSEMLTHERPPPSAYLELFHQAMAQNASLLAEHLIDLAQQIVHSRPAGITLVSLARAGTPIGVILKHILQDYWHKDVAHYSVSIFRDVGLDLNALDYILQQQRAESLVFVDGWTGKGVIARQLAKSLSTYQQQKGIRVPAELFVVSDLCGQASYSATNEDYLIPSSLLNATISGLVSRSILNPELLTQEDFHGCVYYTELQPYDLSRYFVAEMLAHVAKIATSKQPETHLCRVDKVQLQAQTQAFLDTISTKYRITRLNNIKLGIAEATRVLLRREAQRLLVQNQHAEAVQHLLWLAQEKAVPVEILPTMPYQATALIKELSS